MKIGIIREGKVPPDTRVPLTPTQCANIQDKYPVEFVIEPSPNRCFKDEAYKVAGLTVSEDLSDCDVMMGVKEVPIKNLVADKTYFFFSHTIKKQVYNRSLLQAILKKNIRLVDYEVLTNEKGKRLIAFGKFAGMVGAHNGIMTYGRRTKTFDLKRMNQCFDYAEAKEVYKNLALPAMKIVVTGSGRVSTGAIEVLEDMGVERVSTEDFLTKTFDKAVFTQTVCVDYAARKSDGGFDKPEFYKNATLYKSIFKPYTQAADIMINGIYWDNEAPQFFTKEEMKAEDFNIQVIADVTCDIAPIASIPSTIFASTIADPIFGYDPQTEKEAAPHQKHVIDMMTVDNLPNELPRDASTSFGEQFTTHIIEALLADNDIMERGTVAQNGDLGKHFEYLHDYAFETKI